MLKLRGLQMRILIDEVLNSKVYELLRTLTCFKTFSNFIINSSNFTTMLEMLLDVGYCCSVDGLWKKVDMQEW